MRIEGKCPRSEMVRGGLVALLMLGISGWFFFDGFVNYPRKNLKLAIENLPAGWQEVKKEADWPEINNKVTEQGVMFLREKMKLEDVFARLGEPGLRHKDELRYFGPAGYLEIVTIGKLVKSYRYVASEKPRASDILIQKVLGAVFLLIGGWLALKFLGMVRSRTVLTDEGLILNGKGPITWDEMEELDNSEYQRKVWVYLKHTHGGRPTRVKLDKYRIDTFREVVLEICDRKGFEPPFEKQPAEPAAAEDSDGAEQDANGDPQ